MPTVTPAQIRTCTPVTVRPVVPRFLAVTTMTSYRAVALAITEVWPGPDGFRTTASLVPLDRAAEVKSAIVDGLLEAYARARAAGEMLYACVPDGEVSDVISRMEHQVPGLRHVLACEAGPTMSAALASSRCEARDALAAHDAQVPAPALQVATDASMRQHKRGAGLGVLTEHGEAIIELLPQARTIAQGELAAIALALRTVKRDNLTILCDSRWAVGVVRRLLQATDRTAQSKVAARLDSLSQSIAFTIADRLRGRTVDISWVKGHADNQLNLGADRLAVLARRTATAGSPAVAVESVAARIAEDHIGAAARTQVAAIGKLLRRHLDS